jgi:hypothetical protein
LLGESPAEPLVDQGSESGAAVGTSIKIACAVMPKCSTNCRQ